MRGCRNRRLWLIGAFVLGTLYVGGQANAEGFTFDDDEGLVFDDDDGFVFDDDDGFVFDDDDFGFDDDDFDFSDGDGLDLTQEEGIVLPPMDDGGAYDLLAPATVTAMVVPRGPVDPEIVEALSDALFAELDTLEHLSTRSNDELREEFEVMGSELAFECAFDSVCLGGYGRRLGYDQIAMGRIEIDEETEEWVFTINLVGSEQSSVLSFRTIRTAPDIEAVQETLPRQIRALYGIRMERRTAGQAVSSGRWQRGVAFGALGGAVVALGVGAYFGVKASSIEDDVRATEEVDGVTIYSMDQRTARSEIDRGQQMATNANMFFAIGGGLALVSAVFFIVTPGADIDIEGDADLARADQPARRWMPTIRSAGLGLSSSWRF